MKTVILILRQSVPQNSREFLMTAECYCEFEYRVDVIREYSAHKLAGNPEELISSAHESLKS
jgi:hypothetical protein